MSIASDDISDGLLVAVAGHKTLAQKHAQVAGQGRLGLIYGLILADEAAQLGANLPGPGLQLGVGKLLAGQDREGRTGEGEDGQERGDKARHSLFSRAMRGARVEVQTSGVIGPTCL